MKLSRMRGRFCSRPVVSGSASFIRNQSSPGHTFWGWCPVVGKVLAGSCLVFFKRKTFRWIRALSLRLFWSSCADWHSSGLDQRKQVPCRFSTVPLCCGRRSLLQTTSMPKAIHHSTVRVGTSRSWGSTKCLYFLSLKSVAEADHGARPPWLTSYDWN